MSQNWFTIVTYHFQFFSLVLSLSLWLHSPWPLCLRF